MAILRTPLLSLCERRNRFRALDEPVDIPPKPSKPRRLNLPPFLQEHTRIR
jgi:hypothetical protein